MYNLSAVLCLTLITLDMLGTINELQLIETCSVFLVRPLPRLVTVDHRIRAAHDVMAREPLNDEQDYLKA